MQKMYLLLRKNKQSGPYPLNELVKLDLKPMDLLWVEGQSKNWSYSTELPELKDYIKEEKKNEEAASVYPQDAANLVLPKVSNKSANKETPSAIHVEVYVKLPERYKAGSGDNVKEKQEEAIATSLAYAEPDTGKEPGYDVLNKKYVRDLDDIKEEYSKWIGRQKSNPLQPVKKKFLIRWSILMLLIAGAFIAERWNGTDSAENIILKADSIEVQPVLQKVSVTKQAKNKKASDQETLKGKKSKDKVVESSSGEKAEVKEKEKVKEKDEEKEKESDHNVKAAKVDADALFRQLAIRYSYDTSSHHGLRGLHFTIHNNSIHTLNTVALNVVYKNHEGELLHKETIYFNNLHPGKSSTTSGSPHEHATAVTYKTGLISIDGNIYYSKEE